MGKHIVEFLAPCWLRIGGYWHPRGGILNDVFRQYGKVPAGTWIPDQGSLNTEVVDRNIRLFYNNNLSLVWHKNICFHDIMQ
ncbi:MAG: hypothetical protein L7W42_02915 [Alphaproteobacteria bacterium]|nr:hypothetical protein [Alphaproteobacteria bacterium]